MAVATVLTTAGAFSAGSAAWAGGAHHPPPPHHGGGGATGGTTGGTTGGGSTGITSGYVIPITFVFAPSTSRVLSLSSCPSTGHVGWPVQVGFQATDGGAPSYGQRIIVGASGPASVWGTAPVTNSAGTTAITVAPYGFGAVTVTGYWDLNGNGSVDAGEPTSGACVIAVS